MIQEDINNKTVALATNSVKMTTRILLKMIDAFLKHQKGKSQGVKHGKQSIKNLAKQGKSITNIEITNKNIKSFEKYARKYNVDYALKKIHYKDNDGFDKYKHVVFFKAQDSESIKLAFTEYSKDMLERANSKNTPIIEMLENYRDRLEVKIQEPDVEVLPQKEQEEILQLESKEDKDVGVQPSKSNESKEEKDVVVPPVKIEESIPTYEPETPEEIAGLMESYNPADFGEYNPYEDEDLLKEFSNNNYDYGIPMFMSNEDEDYNYNIPDDYNNIESSSPTSISQEKPKDNISNKDKNPVKKKSITEKLESKKKERQAKPKAKVEEVKKPKPKSKGGDAR